MVKHTRNIGRWLYLCTHPYKPNIFKVGESKNPQKRMRQLFETCHDGIPTLLATRKLPIGMTDRMVHRHISSYRLIPFGRGSEWFKFKNDAEARKIFDGICFHAISKQECTFFRCAYMRTEPGVNGSETSYSNTCAQHMQESAHKAHQAQSDCDGEAEWTEEHETMSELIDEHKYMTRWKAETKGTNLDGMEIPKNVKVHACNNAKPMGKWIVEVETAEQAFTLAAVRDYKTNCEELKDVIKRKRDHEKCTQETTISLKKVLTEYDPCVIDAAVNAHEQKESLKLNDLKKKQKMLHFRNSFVDSVQFNTMTDPVAAKV